MVIEEVQRNFFNRKTRAIYLSGEFSSCKNLNFKKVKLYIKQALGQTKSINTYIVIDEYYVLKVSVFMIDAYKHFWTKAFDFKGKTSRKDYWFAILANFLVLLIYSFFILLPSSLINEFFYLLMSSIYFLYFIRIAIYLSKTN